MPRCTDCRHYEWNDEDIDGHIVSSWAACRARHGVSNLQQFPFKQTQCEKFDTKEGGDG